MSYQRLCASDGRLRGEVQLIVARGLSRAAADAQQLAPIAKQIDANTGQQAEEFSGDADHCSDGNLAMLARRHIDGYVATGRQRHTERSEAGRRRVRAGTHVVRPIVVARSRSCAL
jgi:hypothetical protein